VHGRHCPNVQNLLYESDRRIGVEWARESGSETNKRATYPVRLTVICDDRPGMLKEITATASEENTNIRSMDTRSGPNETAMIDLTLDAQDLRHLERMQQGLRRITGVRDVQRLSKL
jgi:guanosine-3',5'-bis(diphosphate) 3'-pyrophosphohydrolase